MCCVKKRRLYFSIGLLAAIALYIWASAAVFAAFRNCDVSHDNADKQVYKGSSVSDLKLNSHDQNLGRIKVKSGGTEPESCQAAVFWAPKNVGDVDLAIGKSLILDFGWKQLKGKSCATAAIVIGASARSCHQAFRISIEVKRQRSSIPSLGKAFASNQRNLMEEALQVVTKPPPFDARMNTWILQDGCRVEGRHSPGRRVVGQLNKVLVEEKIVLLNAFASRKAEQLSNSKPFAPKSFRLDDAEQRKSFGSLIPCRGKNDQWLLKKGFHGGRGIEVPETYEMIRRVHLSDVVGCGDGSGGESVTIKPPRTPDLIGRSQNAMDVVFAQEIIEPIYWSQGQRFMTRVFYALVRNGEAPFVVDRIEASLEVDPIAGYDLWIMNDPYAVVHKGIVSDDDVKNTIHFKEDIDAVIQEQFGHVAWVDKVMIPRVAEVALASFNSLQAHLSEGSESAAFAERIWTVEPPGTYRFLALDFLISASLDLIVIDATASGISMRPELRNRFGIQMAKLLLAIMKGAGRDDGRQVQNWTFVGRLPAIPHI